MIVGPSACKIPTKKLLPLDRLIDFDFCSVTPSTHGTSTEGKFDLYQKRCEMNFLIGFNRKTTWVLLPVRNYRTADDARITERVIGGFGQYFFTDYMRVLYVFSD